ncbi:MAG TPA: hypothetical protein VFT66_03205 [Roseiflexaceae bacterium]|nr:hypothetical protein [Roseiflexaceae bacterium]
MAVIVLGVFDDALTARRAMEDLRDSTYPFEDVSIITRQTEDGEAVSNNDDVSAGEGAAVGAVWGGLVGLGALLIPGIGPFIAGGALFAALTGAITGAVVGGVTAALVDFGGIPEAEARQYEQYVHEGKTLIAVKARDSSDAHEARQILAQHGADGVYDENERESEATSAAPRVAMYEGGTRIHAGDELSVNTPTDIGMIQPNPLGADVVTPRATGGTEPVVPEADAVPEAADARINTDTERPHDSRA